MRSNNITAPLQVYKRIPLVVRYTACGGLFNQHYSHVAALSLALALGGDVVLPAAVKRDSFANYFSQDPSKNQVGEAGLGLLMCLTYTPVGTVGWRRWPTALARTPLNHLTDVGCAGRVWTVGLRCVVLPMVNALHSAAQTTRHKEGHRTRGPSAFQVSWTAVPFDTLWDGDAAHSWLKGACSHRVAAAAKDLSITCIVSPWWACLDLVETSFDPTKHSVPVQQHLLPASVP